MRDFEITDIDEFDDESEFYFDQDNRDSDYIEDFEDRDDDDSYDYRPISEL